MLEGLSDRAKATVFTGMVLAMSLATAPIMGGLVLALFPLLMTLVMMLAWIGADLVMAGDKVAFDEYLAGDTGLFVLCGTAPAPPS